MTRSTMKRMGDRLGVVKETLFKIGEELRPVISVITSVLDGEKKIESCLKNVINQGCLDKIEHIICDGGSCDKTMEILKEYANKYAHIRFISIPGAGEGRSLNEALRRAQGRVIGVLNVNDFYSKGALQKMVKDFENLPEGSFVTGNLRILNKYNWPMEVHRYDNLNFNDVVWGRMFFPWSSSAYFYHKSLHEKVGYYDEHEECNKDLDFILRALRSAHVFYEDQDIGNWHSFSGHESYRCYASQEPKEDVKEVLKKYRSNEIPQFPQKLPGQLWGITAFFNPAGQAIRYKNYAKFRLGSRRQGLKLLTVELVFGDHLFELVQEDAEILIQIRGGEENILWQKEALFNLALKKLPKECDKIVWVDGDILFKNDNWVIETRELLETYKVVQPYSWIINLKDGQDDEDPLKVSFGYGDNKQFFGMAYAVAECGQEITWGPYVLNGHAGFAWACRRDLIENLCFFDSAILQNNDSLMAFAFYGCFSQRILRNPAIYLPAQGTRWVQRAWELVQGSVYYCPGMVLHLWHGSQHSRIYHTTKNNHLLRIMKETKFDFDKEIYKNNLGLWEWRENSSKIFREELRSFYLNRPVK